MASWIYVFSKFTPEALLFEALFIFLLLSGYLAFWVLRKRRLGAVKNEVPASVVKLYLSELIGDAEQMRTQLFGLLSREAAPATGHAPAARVQLDAALQGGAVDSALLQRLAALETQSAEQVQSLTQAAEEKARLEKKLSEALKGAGGAPATAPAENSEETAKLKDKLSVLEARLAEYSVIEDDLANLKRLQQENTSLKAQLSSGGAAKTAAPTAAAPTPAPAAAAPAPAAAEPAAPSPAAEAPALDTGLGNLTAQLEAALKEPSEAPAAIANQDETLAALEAAMAGAAAEPSAPAAAAPAPAAGANQDETLAALEAAMAGAAAEASAPAAPPSGGNIPETEDLSAEALRSVQAQNPSAPAAAAADLPPSFEGLVDDVEKSLQGSSAAGAQAKTEKAPEEAALSTPTVEKTDEDLIAEFEKMLNS